MRKGIKNILRKSNFLVKIKRKLVNNNDVIKNLKYTDISYFANSVNTDIKNEKIILVSHSGGQGGAEVLLENIAKEMVKQCVDVIIFSRGDGPIIKRYKAIAPTYVLDTVENTIMAIEKFSSFGYKKVVLNTIVNGDLISEFKKNNYKVVSLVHELPGVIKMLKCEDRVLEIAKNADEVVFPANYVKEKFETMAKVETNSNIKPQGLYMKYNNYNKINGKKYMSQKYNIPLKNKIIMNAGLGEYRKGFDLFAKVAKKFENENITFLWVGTVDETLECNKKINNLIMPGFISDRNEFVRFYEASDVFVLTSREDPFPSVVLEAFNASLPVIAFKDAGGFQDIVRDNISGYLVDYENTDMIIEKIKFLIENEDKRLELGINAKKISDEHSFNKYVEFLIELFR